ncbi:hypothetical protein M3148_14350 [Georgenia satyanarayanai]|uniref:hypothetical protein n=1 Tax=Georgenia satyanarayanai TaxID=860221 RepID=UPI00204008C1|nr:hypothetical protein [Georgenia satyanarayanai]MCM3662162.1 hypothetical protein [Georgenia satyanarayanai]
MSVAAVVTYRPGSEGTSYLPVATEDAFRRTWLPLAEAAGLEIVPRFADGLVVDRAQDAVLGAELARLRADLAGRPDLEHVRVRAGLLAALVQEVAARRNDVVELYIG